MKIENNLRIRNNFIFVCVLGVSICAALAFNYSKLSLQDTATNLIYAVQVKNNQRVSEITSNGFNPDFGNIARLNLESIKWGEASFYTEVNADTLDKAAIEAQGEYSDGKIVALEFYFTEIEGQWLVSDLKIKSIE